MCNEVFDARRAGDIDKADELIAETKKLFGNSAYGKTFINKEKIVSISYGNEDNIPKKINSPHFKLAIVWIKLWGNIKEKNN